MGSWGKMDLVTGGRKLFKEKMERIWEERGEVMRGGWKELKEDIQGVLREGQGGGKRRGW